MPGLSPGLFYAKWNFSNPYIFVQNKAACLTETNSFVMNILLKRVLDRLVRTGNLKVTGPKGSTVVFGDGSGEPVHMHIKTTACRARHHLRSDAGGAGSLHGRRTRHSSRAACWADAHRLPEHGQRRHRRDLVEGDRGAASRLPAPAADQHCVARAPQRRSGTTICRATSTGSSSMRTCSIPAPISSSRT